MRYDSHSYVLCISLKHAHRQHFFFHVLKENIEGHLTSTDIFQANLALGRLNVVVVCLFYVKKPEMKQPSMYLRWCYFPCQKAVIAAAIVPSSHSES